MRLSMKMFAIAALALALTAGPALAQTPGTAKPAGETQKPAPPAEPHDHSHMSNTAESSSPAQKYFTDVELINQDGKKVHFYSDVLKGKTVIVNAFFTSCTSVCPPMNRNMEKIQEALGDR